MKQNYFSFYVFEPEYFDTFVIKKKALGHLRVPARDEDTDLLFVAEDFLPFSDRPIKNDKLDTFILPVQDAYHALKQSFDLFFMTREVYGVFYNRLTWDDFPEDWMEKAFVKITTYGDDLCKMRVEIYLDGNWKKNNDNIINGIYQGDTPRIDIPMVFTDEQTDSYGMREIRELRTGFKPNHTDDAIISLTTDEYTGATSITFKTPRVNLEDMLWFTEDMMSSCDSGDMVTVQLTMENPAVRVVTNRVGVADKEPEDEDTVDISGEDCVEDDEELSKLESGRLIIEVRGMEMTDKLIAAMEKTIVHRIAYLGGIIEYVEVYFYRLTKGDDSPEAKVMRSQLHTINQDLDEMEDDYEEFKSLIQLSDREDDILRVYGGIISLFDLAGDEFDHFVKEFEDYVYKKIGKGEVE